MENIIYLDLDGVILDSDERLREMKKRAGFGYYKRETYQDYFNYVLNHEEEWNYILKEAKPINNSIEIIKKLELLKRNIIILTKIYSLKEMDLKVEVIRHIYKLNNDIIFVPPSASKSSVVNPINNLLIDDFDKNVKDWVSHGGKAFLFDKNTKQNTKTKIRSLDVLLEGEI